ncbi:GPM6B protein, partial [Polyodon spathula]|nr:GPM6B protein [Polyodon spathula]
MISSFSFPKAHYFYDLHKQKMAEPKENRFESLTNPTIHEVESMNLPKTRYNAIQTLDYRTGETKNFSLQNLMRVDIQISRNIQKQPILHQQLASSEMLEVENKPSCSQSWPALAHGSMSCLNPLLPLVQLKSAAHSSGSGILPPLPSSILKPGSRAAPRRFVSPGWVERELLFGYHIWCFECCIKCLGGVPYASLVATILCFSGVALFCGCGHVALTGTVSILENHFSKTVSDHAFLTEVVQLMQYIIYGIASFFFLYGIILLAEGFYTTSAVKELHSEFKTTACGRCISGMFVFLTYVLGVAWLGVFGFSAVPVFLFYNMWSTCQVLNSPMANMTSSIESICVDVRQYGIIPWNAAPGKACGAVLGEICNTSEFYLSYHLYIVACAGAGATVIALIHFLMILSANWAYLKDASHMHVYQDIKMKEEQELQDIQSRSKEQLNSYT